MDAREQFRRQDRVTAAFFEKKEPKKGKPTAGQNTLRKDPQRGLKKFSFLNNERDYARCNRQRHVNLLGLGPIRSAQLLFKLPL
jgi:hypothetical protein